MNSIKSSSYQALITVITIFAIVEQFSFRSLILIIAHKFSMRLIRENFQASLKPPVHFFQRMCAFYVSLVSSKILLKITICIRKFPCHHWKQMSTQKSLVFASIHNALYVNKWSKTFCTKTSSKHLLMRLFGRLLNIYDDKGNICIPNLGKIGDNFSVHKHYELVR